MGGSNSKQAFRAAILDLVNNQQVSRQKPRTTILSEILLANYVRGWKVNFKFDIGCPATQQLRYSDFRRKELHL